MSARKIALLMGAALFGFAGAYVHFAIKADRTKAEAAAREAELAAKIALLETQLDGTRNRQPEIVLPELSPVPLAAKGETAEEILQRLKSMQPTADSTRRARRAIHELEKLIDLGPAALPALKEFLASGTDARYGQLRSFPNGRIPMSFSMPPTLRLGLLEAVHEIGGEPAEEIFSEVLKNSAQASELAYVTYALQELVPGKYRETIIATARDALSRRSDASTPDRKLDREYLFGILAFYGDPSYVATAQNQLVLPDGKIDKSAINYLQGVLGEASLPLVQQTWQDARIAPDQKEPLARVALTYAGANPQADQFYQAAINDAGLSAKQRKNLIEDLNETGFANPAHLTDADLPLIQKRIGLIEQLAPGAMDKVNADAFQEAYKDLLNMRASLLSPTDKPK